MLGTLHDEAIVPCKYGVADCLSGNSPAFLAGLDRFVECVYMVAVPSDTRAWLAGPVMETTQYRSGGAPCAPNDRSPPRTARRPQWR